MTLAGANANTFSGGLDINAGTLVATTNEQLGTGSVTVGADSTLAIDATTTQTIAGLAVHSGTLNNSGTLTSTSRNKIANQGEINNLLADSVINGGVRNQSSSANLVNNGTINGGIENLAGSVTNGTSTSVINGGLSNSISSVVDNAGTINGGVTNFGTLNSNTATSVITGGLTNHGEANLRNQVSGAIVNQSQASRSVGGDRGRAAARAAEPTITVDGDLVADSTLLNKDNAVVHVKDGNFTGITTLTNASQNAAGIQIDATRTLGANAVINQVGSTIVNSGTLQSATVINNSGTITTTQVRPSTEALTITMPMR